MAVVLRDKDILFVVLNIVVFFGFVAWFLLNEMILIMGTSFELTYPSMALVVILIQWLAWACWVIATFIVILCDLWWASRLYNQWKRNYRRDNL